VKLWFARSKRVTTYLLLLLKLLKKQVLQEPLAELLLPAAVEVDVS
jgi:hypothetical protein